MYDNSHWRLFCFYLANQDNHAHDLLGFTWLDRQGGVFYIFLIRVSVGSICMQLLRSGRLRVCLLVQNWTSNLRHSSQILSRILEELAVSRRDVHGRVRAPPPRLGPVSPRARANFTDRSFVFCHYVLISSFLDFSVNIVAQGNRKKGIVGKRGHAPSLLLFYPVWRERLTWE